MTTDNVFLFIKVVIRTKHQHIQDAMKELENQTQYSIGSTENVEVLETEIIKLNKEQLNKNTVGHNLNYHEQTEKHSFFSVKEKAKHNLGQIITCYPTSA